jgi:APA family basic amino acid/polyamine antiporter
MALNIVFFISAPQSELSAVVEIGHVAAVHLFGARAGVWFSLLIAVALLSSVSAMIMVGPRVYEKMGADYPALSFLKYRTSRGGPVVAVALQYFISLIMILTATFESLLTYIGYLLSLASALVVVGVFVLRQKEPNINRPYKTFAYPVTPTLFVLLCIWMIVRSVAEKPIVAIVGAATVVSGLIVYYLIRKYR